MAAFPDTGTRVDFNDPQIWAALRELGDATARVIWRIGNVFRDAFPSLEEIRIDLELSKGSRIATEREAARIAGEEIDRRRRPRRAEHQVFEPPAPALWARSLLAWR